MTTSTIATCDHGIVSKTKRVVMDRDVYDRKWKLGPFSSKKQELKKEGKLDKHGRVQDNTPEAWKMLFGDPEKAVKVEEVVKAVSGSAKPTRKASSSSAKNKVVEDSDEEEEAPKKKEKKEKKAKKSKKVVESSDEEEEEEEKPKKKSKKDKKDKKKSKKVVDSDSD
eukprot:scpid83350/ scgid25708/ Centromere/microtubule-binding protein CBF5; Centromere-binding factor 5; H/ACA snoRNP protein CBF5; Small nucleolar RNP protein CBF5